MMKKFLAISIDVEPDCSVDWTYSNPLAFRGVTEGIASRLHPLFIKYGMKPTYLVNNVVLDDKPSVNVLSNLKGSYELGSHLHPEFIEPQKEFQDYAGKRGLANSCHYSPDIEAAKIQSITTLFRNCFGYSPTSFRAGRFSAGVNTMRTLATLGYKVDTSVTPHVRWEDSSRKEAVDFRQGPEQPYLMDANNILAADNQGTLLQVPVSITTRKASLLRELKRTRFGLRGKIKAETAVWLRPAVSTTKELLALMDEFTAKYANSPVIVFNMMFHNVEVMPGLSPYTRTESDCQAYMQQLEAVFQYTKRNQILGCGLTDLYDEYRR